MKTVVRGLVALAAVFVVGNAAHGLTFTATGHGDDTNETLSASATFVITNLQLVITLSNNGTFDPDDTADILTGIYFTLAGDPLLTRTGAVLGPDTAIKDRSGVNGPGTSVGADWAYRNNLSSQTNQPDEALTIASLKGFGGKRYRFAGPKPGSPGGVKYGVTTDFDNMGNDKGGLKNKQLIENTVIFTLGGLPTNFTLADISNVHFQYGTSPTDANLAGTLSDTGGTPVIPEPNTIVLVAAGLLGCLRLGAITRRRRPSSHGPGQARSRPALPPGARGSPTERFG